jgi:hypothetical protein
MGEHEFELREVPHELPESEGEPLQESVVGDVAASVAAVANVGMLGYVAASFHRGRHDADDARHEADTAALRAQHAAEMRVLRAHLEVEMRDLRAQRFGFGVDDDYDPGFGVDDDYDPGFEADDDYYGEF